MSKATSLTLLFSTMVTMLSLTSFVRSSQVNSFSASQTATATSAASASTLSASATSSSSATTESSSSLTDSKNAKSTSNASKVTVTLLISTTNKHTFTLPQDDFDLLQKIFTFKKLTGNNTYTIAGADEYEAARIALNYLSKDEDSAGKELLDYVMKNSEEPSARAAWCCFCDCSLEFGDTIGNPNLDTYPRLQRLGQVLTLWRF